MRKAYERQITPCKRRREFGAMRKCGYSKRAEFCLKTGLLQAGVLFVAVLLYTQKKQGGFLKKSHKAIDIFGKTMYH